VKRTMLTYLEKSTKSASSGVSSVNAVECDVSGHTPSHSSVSTFGVRYDPPLPDLSSAHGVEALVEGSKMSMLREGAFISLKKLFIFNFV
jgi:hypothetical protein